MHKYSSFAWLDRSLDVHELQFQRVAHRQLIVHQFRKYFADALASSRIRVDGRGCVCLVGSVPRGEFDVENSDVDLWFLGLDPLARNQVLKAISQEFKSADIGLTEDDFRLLLRNEGKALQRDWKKYPCLDEADFLASGVRRAQILFETVAVHNPERHLQLQKLALQAAGVAIRGRDVRQNPEQIYRDIGAYAATTEKLEFAHGVDFAKQLVIRRLGQHLMRLSVLEAVFRKRSVSDSLDPEGRFIEILQAPTASKALFWASTEFLNGRMMASISMQEFPTLHRDLRKLVGVADFGLQTACDPRKLVGRLAILATREYSSALNLLHSKSLRAVLLQLEDFALPYHAADPNVDQLVTTATRFVCTCTALVKALELIFLRYDAARKFTRPYPNSGLQLAVRETLAGLSSDPLTNNN